MNAQATQQKSSHLYKECITCHEVLYAPNNFYKRPRAKKSKRVVYSGSCKSCTVKRNITNKLILQDRLDIESHIVDPHRNGFWEARDLNMAWACSCEFCTDMTLYLITKGFDRKN